MISHRTRDPKHVNVIFFIDFILYPPLADVQALKLFNEVDDSMCQLVLENVMKVKASEDFISSIEAKEGGEEVVKSMGLKSKLHLTNFFVKEATRDAIIELLTVCMF